MSRSTTYVIIGGGLAGAKAAEALRGNDFDGHIVLFAAGGPPSLRAASAVQGVHGGKEVVRGIHRAQCRVVPRSRRRPADWAPR